MNKSAGWLLVVAIAAVLIAAVVLLPRHEAPEQHTAIPSEKSPATAADNEPLRRFPVPESGADAVAADTTTAIEPSKPLPPLQESDAALLESLGRLFDPKRLGELFIVKNLINRLVVTIDNLPRAKLPLRYLPVTPPPGKFLVTKTADGATEIDPANYQRYAKFVRFIEGINTQDMVSVYFHFYPLFQEAYSDLGYKTAYFNDRLVEVIDHLLAVPAVTEPVRLIQPSVFYKYADPRLESLSAGQKIMIRIGNDNAAAIKAKLQELRNALVRHGLKTRAPPA